MYYGNEATNITYFSVEHAKIMDAVFYRSNVSIMWTMDSLSNQSSNLYFSRQKVRKRIFLNMLKMLSKWIKTDLSTKSNVYFRFYNIPRGNIAEYDAAEIHNCGMLRKHLIGVTAHLGWQMVGFFLFLYR